MIICRSLSLWVWPAACSVSQSDFRVCIESGTRGFLSIVETIFAIMWRVDISSKVSKELQRRRKRWRSRRFWISMEVRGRFAGTSNQMWQTDDLKTIWCHWMAEISHSWVGAFQHVVTSHNMMPPWEQPWRSTPFSSSLQFAFKLYGFATILEAFASRFHDWSLRMFNRIYRSYECEPH